MRMNDPEQPRPAPAVKRYPFRFSPLILALLVAGLLLCLAGFGFTTWQFSDFLQGEISSVYEWLKYILLYFVSVLLAVLILAMLVKSQYVIGGRKLILQFGLIRSTYDIGKIVSVQHFRGSGKLTVYFDDFKTKFMVIVVKESWYDDFVQTLLERNERITYDFVTAEEEQNYRKK